jgi:hypothetical protein
VTGVTDPPDSVPDWQPIAAPDAPPYGAPPGQPPLPPYGAPPSPAGRLDAQGRYPAPGSTNGFAIAALVCALAGLLIGVTGVLGLIFGIVGLRQTSRRGERGRGLAITGIVLGAIEILVIVVVVAVHLSQGSSNGSGGPLLPA